MIGGPGDDRLMGQKGRDRAKGGMGVDACLAEAATGCE
jgi:hypothetical protein